MVPIVISAVSATVAILSLIATVFLFLKGQKRNATMVMYRAHLDSIMIGINHPYVLNWEPELIDGLNSEQSKIYYQYVFFLLNAAEMSEQSESNFLEEGQLLDLYADVHKGILTVMPEKICNTFSPRVRQRLRSKLPESNW